MCMYICTVYTYAYIYTHNRKTHTYVFIYIDIYLHYVLAFYWDALKVNFAPASVREGLC